MAGPSPYNRKLKAKNDRRKARAARGGRTPSEAGLAQSMAAAGNKVSKSNQRVGAPATKPKFGKPRKARRTGRPDYDSMTLDELARQPNLPERYREAAGLAAVRPDYETLDKMKVVGEDGKELTRLELAGQVGEVGSMLIPVGGGLGAAAKIIGTAGRAAPKVVRGANTAAKVAKSGKGGSTVKKALKAAPGKAKGKAVQTGKKAKRNTKKLGTKAGAKGAAKAPLRVARKNPAIATGAYAMAADKAGASDPITRTVAADARGIVDAVDSPSDLLKTAETTARVIPGSIAGLGAAVGAGAETVYRAGRAGLDEAGVPVLGKDYSGEEIASPVVDTAKASIEGTAALVDPFLKGDEEAVTRVVRDQLGFAPIVFTPRVLRAARNSDFYKNRRANVRASAAEGRRKRKDKAIQQRQAEVGADKTVTKDAPRDAETDSRADGREEYLIQPLGRFIEKRRAARDVSRSGDRTFRAVDREVYYLAEDLTRKLAKGRRIGGKKRGKDFVGGLAAAVQFAARQGLGRNKALVKGELDTIIRQIERPDLSDPSLAGTVNDRQAIRFLQDNLEVIDAPEFWEAVNTVKKITAEGTKGLKGEDGGIRARYLAAADRFGIKDPIRVVEEDGVRVNGKLVQGKWDPDTSMRRESRARELIEQANDLDRDSRELDPADPEAVKLIRRSAMKRRQARELRARERELVGAYKIAEKDFAEKTRSALLLRGQNPEPAWIRDSKRQAVGDDKGIIVEKAGLPVPKAVTNEKVNEGVLRRQGEADRAFDTFARESILRPRLIKAINSFTREVIGRYHLKIPDKDGNQSIMNDSTAIANAMAEGRIPRGYTAVHSQFYSGAMRGKDAQMDEAEIERITGDGVELVVDADDFRQALINGKVKPGHKYILVKKSAWDEYLNQVQGTNSAAIKFATRVNRLASTGILGYNPSWAIAQQFAEGIPALIAIGANPSVWNYLLQAEKAYQRMSPAEKAAIDSVSGSAGGTLRSMGSIKQGGLPDYDVVAMPKFVRQSPLYQQLPKRKANAQDLDDFYVGAGGKGWDTMKRLAKGQGLNDFVLWTGGKYRRGVMNAEIAKRRRSSIVSLTKASTRMKAIDDRLKGMDPKEAQLFLARNPKEAARLAGYMEDTMGNWTALTKAEGNIAPFTAFYPYLRYSLRWAFYGFPMRHPIKAQILYFLAQQNANQLEEIIGGEPVDWLDYASPVITVDGEKRRLPGASRFAPAMSSIVEAVGTGQWQRLANALNPGFGLVGETVLGFDAYQGESVAFRADGLDRLALAASGLASMLAPVRWTDSIVPGGTISRITPRRDWSKPRTSIIGGKSETSKQFRLDDPNAYPDSFWDLLGARTSFNVLAPQDGDDYRREVQRQRALKEARYSDASKRNPGKGGTSSTNSTPDPWWASP